MRTPAPTPTPADEALIVGDTSHSGLLAVLETRGLTARLVALDQLAAACVRAIPGLIVAAVPDAAQMQQIDAIRRRRAPHAPLLAILDSPPEALLAAARERADDVLLSPFSDLEFGLRLDVMRRIHELQVALAQSHERLKALALTDELTGLLKQSEFRRRLDVEVRRIRRFRIPVACVFFDCDHFKRVNDTYGHEAGSFVLAEIARMVTENLRETDIVGRYGGDEFVIGMPGCGAFEAAAVARRLAATVRDHVFETADQQIRVTLSMGVASATPREPRTTADLLECADQALYQAKRQGRDQVVAFQPATAPASVP